MIAPNLTFIYGNDVLCLEFGGKYNLTYNAEKSNYAGTGADINAGFVYNIFSDLQVGLNATARLDLTEAKQNDFEAKLTMALAF